MLCIEAGERISIKSCNGALTFVSFASTGVYFSHIMIGRITKLVLGLQRGLVLAVLVFVAATVLTLFMFRLSWLKKIAL